MDDPDAWSFELNLNKEVFIALAWYTDDIGNLWYWSYPLNFLHHLFGTFNTVLSKKTFVENDTLLFD